MIEQIDECVFEVAGGDITKYESLGQQPGDLFFKWLGWMRRQEKQRIEFEAALHGVKLSGSGKSSGVESRSSGTGGSHESMAETAGNFGGKTNFKRNKVSQEEKARRLAALRQKANGKKQTANGDNK